MDSQVVATTHSAVEDGDASPPYKLLLSCPLGLSPSQVSADFNVSYDRIPHPDIDLENSISEIWDQRIQRNASLYNGTKFRYAGYITDKEGSGFDKISWVSLHLGLTDYRTFVGTNLNPLWETFLVPSKEDTICCQHTSSPLGNGAIVETLDKKILVLRRSNNVGEFPGHFVFPGGHPEPQEIGIVCHQPGKSLRESEMLNKRVSEEMFDSIVREVNEEIGVPGSSLARLTYLA
ncbi:nudix hydrolase 9 isoform X2 [Rhodamnia argentea]|uniref:Nudix hydrolase 9 isoform X2 n=1 Tax=Rhodamnia argentea TaxID=178133 RepID=A0A8B8NPV2_9MYRT|nr:nudix hydrolase 9 isoform X2 [Rhodamnia argentea]